VFLAYDQVKIGKPKIVLENTRYLKIAAIISKAGVYKYDDGMALKSARELRKAVRSARYAKLTLVDHPAEKIIMSQDQIFGGVEKPFFENNKMHAILSFDKEVVPKETLRKVRAGDFKDVSIGFYYRADFTPGWHRDVNTGKPTHYDYIMRNIMIDHVVAAVGPGMAGRCRFPQCGIGVNTIMKRFSIGEDKVVKRGNQWCVIHCSGPNAGKAIKCFPTEPEAQAMHRAIQARKHGGQTDLFIALESLNIDITALTPQDRMLLFGDAEQPSKQWMDNCKAKAGSFADNPGAFCGWVWHHGPADLKRSFGTSSVPVNRRKTKLSQEEETVYAKCVREKIEGGMPAEEAREACKEKKTDQDEKESPYKICIREKTAAGMTPEEAAEACKAKKTDQEKLESAYEKCLIDKKAEGMTEQEAEAACEALKPTAADQEAEKTPWQKCIATEMAKPDMTMEKAVAACKAKGLGEKKQDEETVAQPVETQEVMPTPLETCIATRMEAHGEDEATAKKWCEADAAGKHQPVSSIVDNINRLREKKRQLNKQ